MNMFVPDLFIDMLNADVGLGDTSCESVNPNTMVYVNDVPVPWRAIHEIEENPIWEEEL